MCIRDRFSDARYSGPDKFIDISGHWAREYINRAAAEGWIAGYPDGTYGPDRSITRAAVMALIHEVDVYKRQAPCVCRRRWRRSCGAMRPGRASPQDRCSAAGTGSPCGGPR